jgi:uncharacterized protein (TIGR02466 family)
MKEIEIHEIFPIPIFKTNINRDLTKKELSLVNKLKLHTYGNAGNTTSDDTYVLNQKMFYNLKNELNLNLKNYYDKIVSSCNDIIPYITQSWLNFTKENEYHHEHDHPNSLVSGVFYINADEKNDRIKFFKRDVYLTIAPTIKEWNVYNSNSWWFPVKTGDILLFPSSLRHCVEIKKGNNTRISLAFNSFVKGTIGNKKKLTELIL